MLLWSLLVIFAPVSEQSDWVTLLAPSSVLEGDSVVLKCQAKWTGGIKTMSYHKDGRQLLSSNKVSTFSIQSAAFNDSGQYHCAISGKLLWNRETTSKAVKLKVQELFPPPVLTASSSQPTEGTPVTLTCETWLPPEKSGTELQFCFFREGQGLGPGWSKSPELHIPTIWSQDSGSYWCEAQTVTPRVKKQSLKSQIHVQRVPVANVSLETQPPGGQVIEGEKLVLLCSVSEGTGNITFSWHRETTETSLGNKTQRSLSAELEILAVKDSDAVPVSRPALTIRVSGAPAMVGDVVELHCEVQRGTHPILYQFYQKDVILGNSSASFGGGASFNLSLTSEHSENYSCEADNGLRAQRSEVVTLNVTGPEGYRKDLVIAGTLGGLFGVLGFVAVALPFYYWYQETSVPVSRPALTIRVSGAQAMVGDMVELHCEVQRGTHPILYQFYQKDVILGNSSASFGGGASFNLSLTSEHSENYSCEADNGLRAQRSQVVTLNVTGPEGYRKDLVIAGTLGGLFGVLGFVAVALPFYYWYHKTSVPVSRPALTIRVSGAPAMVGDVVELHCEVQRGTHPILYQFYQKDVILGNSSASFGGGASFNLSLTSEHSENYSCEADNGLRAQRSEVVTLNVTGPEGYRKDLVIAGTLGGLFGVLGFVAVALPFYYWYQETSGGSSASNVPRGPSSSGSQESTHSSPLPAVGELQPLYANCETIYSNTLTVTEKGQPDYANDGAADKDVVYSQVWSIQQTEGAANTRGTFPETKDSSVTYANVRKT
ncbi:Fc receptor-like protein 2 isoform X4 [Loxodonta africana]|uniref:Fc receptor-like protein 2 isoform X4 n=1 Tax=Loxodonta africana TaxID=9785 RepID=UPI0030D13077